MTSDDFGLQRIESICAAELVRTGQRAQAAADLQAVPERAVLVHEQDGIALRIGARRAARGIEFHECEQPMRIRLLRGKLSQYAPQPKRLTAELRAAIRRHRRR